MSERYSEIRLVGEFCELMGLDGETMEEIMLDTIRKENAIELMLLYHQENIKEGITK